MYYGEGKYVPGRNYITVVGRGLENGSMYVWGRQVPFDIVPGTPKINSYPQGKNLTWQYKDGTNGDKTDGKLIALVDNGSSDVGYFMYSMDGKTFSSEIPQAKEPGTYTIYYMLNINSNCYNWWKPLREPSFVVTSTIEYPKYTVTFHNDEGASYTSSQRVERFQKATEPENPTRQGFTFLSWQCHQLKKK